MNDPVGIFVIAFIIFVGLKSWWEDEDDIFSEDDAFEITQAGKDFLKNS